MQNLPQTKNFYIALTYLRGDGSLTGADGSYHEPAEGKQYDWVYIGDAFAGRLDFHGWRAKIAATHLKEGGHIIFDVACAPNVPLHSVLHYAPDLGGIVQAEINEDRALIVWEKRKDFLYDEAILTIQDAVILQRDYATILNELQRRNDKSQSALLVRFGAIGDILMSACVASGYRERGIKVDFCGSELARELLKADERIDNVYTIPKAMAKELEIMCRFIGAMQERYAHVLVLDLAVEGELLKRPEDRDYYWSDKQRRAVCNRSYLENHYRISGLNAPEKYDCAFRPLMDEVAAMREKFSPAPFIIWAVRGSAIHKWSPFTDEAAALILADHPEHNLVLTGDHTSMQYIKQTADAVRKYTRHAKRIGLMTDSSIREVLTAANLADCVIGPETGVLNSVATLDVPKVCILSHSSEKNLCAHWKNYVALAPKVPCYPCHRMHRDFSTCHKHEETGAALCATSISARSIADAVKTAMQMRQDQPISVRVTL